MTVIAIREQTEPTLRPWREMEPEQRAMLKSACGNPRLDDSKFELLVEVARRAGLDPFRKHLYGLEFGGKFTLLTGIDGFRAVARRNGLAGVDDAIHTYDEEKDPKHRFPLTSTITVYRWGPNGTKEAYTATARFNEYAQMRDGRPTGNWLSKPHVMLDKCAEALAYRKAFTESLGGIYERAEFGEADAASTRKAENAPTTVEQILAEPVPDEHETVNDVEFSEFDPSDKDAP